MKRIFSNTSSQFWYPDIGQFLNIGFNSKNLYKWRKSFQTIMRQTTQRLGGTIWCEPDEMGANYDVTLNKPNA